MSSIPVTFDPKVVFGKVRAPVKVTLNGYSYRSTIFSMGGRVFIPLRASHREAAGVREEATLQVKVELDTQQRTVELPPNLRKALTAAGKDTMACRKKLSSHQREHVHGSSACAAKVNGPATTSTS
ncbi:MAG: DUF1905 domain-containing protein [Pseudomonadota bacterium]